jgi:hypothetical protein
VQQPQFVTQPTFGRDPDVVPQDAGAVAQTPNYYTETVPAPATSYGKLQAPTGEGQALTTFSANDRLGSGGGTAQDIADALRASVQSPPETVTTTPPTSTLGPLEDEHVSALSDADRAALAESQLNAAKGDQTPSNENLPNLSLGYTAPADGVQIAGSQNLVGQFAVNGPTAYTGGIGNPYGDTTPLYDETATSTEDSSADTSSAGPSALPVRVSDNVIADTTTPIIATTTPTLATTAGAGDTAMSSTGYTKNTTAKDVSTTGDTSGLPFGTGTLYSPDTGISTALPIDTTKAADTSTATAPSPILRKYLGAPSDPYRYGFGAERTFYGPAAAQGGYFDAEQYFADGGLVQPLSPPTVPVVSAQPTMAFTDGVGPVGSIAQPPGLAQSDAYGSDAPHASPMAPSVAAAVPSMQPGLATLATPNVNAGPSPSPIAQNPNVGYALGSSPLSTLTRS